CDEWRYDFAAFQRWAESHGWRPDLQIDRIDNDGDYSPDNCRFVTCADNCSNRRNNFYITAFGERKSLSQWARDSRCVVGASTVRVRIIRQQWSPELAIATPVQRKLSIDQSLEISRRHQAGESIAALAREF